MPSRLYRVSTCFDRGNSKGGINGGSRVPSDLLLVVAHHGHRVGRHSSGECRRIIMQDESTATAVRDRDRGDRHEEGLAEAVTLGAHMGDGGRVN